MDGLNDGGMSRAGRRCVYFARAQGAHSGLDSSETITHFGPGISGELWVKGLHQLLINGK